MLARGDKKDKLSSVLQRPEILHPLKLTAKLPLISVIQDQATSERLLWQLLMSHSYQEIDSIALSVLAREAIGDRTKPGRFGSGSQLFYIHYIHSGPCLLSSELF